MKEFASIFISIFLMIAIVEGLTWLLSLSCRAKATKQELQYSYGLIQGCMVKEKNGKWIDYERLRYTE